MSDTQVNGYSDEDKYANDSFETEVPESSVYGSDEETSDTEKPKSASKEFKPFGRTTDFWTCESSSDEDDVVLGQTVAEINTDPGDFDDDNISLTPAARVFKMASASRSSSRIKNIVNQEELTESEVFDDDFEEIDDMTVETESDTEDIFGKYTKITAEDEIMYDERVTFETSGIDVDEVYTDVSVSDGGEVDLEEPNFDQDPEEKEKNLKMDRTEVGESDYENASLSDMEPSPTNSDYDDEKTIGAASIVTASIKSETKSITKSESKSEQKSESKSEHKSDPKSESKSVRTDDSMEDFKRKVKLSQRMRCRSDGGGDCARAKILKSGIPVWTGNKRFEKYLDTPKQPHSAHGVRSMIPIPDTRTHSLPDFSDAETLTPRAIDYKENEQGAFGFEPAAYSDRSDYMAADFYSEYTATTDGDPCAYSMQMEMFMDADDIPKKQKKLKAGERRNKSFSNDRLRDIERHNHILLHKILNQKPTYVLDDKKKKKDKFSYLPPTTRVTSAEINRKQQQRQIDMDNQLLKRKLEAIAKRKPKAKAK